MNWNGSVTEIVAQPASLGEACSIIALRGPAETRFGVAASGVDDGAMPLRKSRQGSPVTGD